VAGSATSDGKKVHLYEGTAAATGTFSADKLDNNLANIKGGQDDKKLEPKVAADAEMEVVSDRADADGIAHAAVCRDSAGSKVEDFAATLEHNVSQGYTTNAADRAMRVAPFTHASHGVSLMVSEVVGGGGVDSDEELGNANVLQAGTLATSSKSPLGSSSSAQLSGHRSVQHMLKQIQDAGERINELISLRDFGARRRLPAVPIDAVNDSDLPTSSQSAKSDGSGGDHHPIRSVFEELPRPVIRSPKFLVKNSSSLAAISRQLPDPSTVKNSAKTDNQLTQPKPGHLRYPDCPLDGQINMKCKKQLFSHFCRKDSMLTDYVPNSEPLICNVEVSAEGEQPEKLSDSFRSDVTNVVCKCISDMTTKLSDVVSTQATPVQPSVVCDILTHVAEKQPESLKLSSSLAEVEVDAEGKHFPDPSVPVDNSVNLVHDADLVASEIWLEKLLNGPREVAAVRKFVSRGMADGESPRNTINDELDRKCSLDEHLLRTAMQGLSGMCEHSSVVPCSKSVVTVTGGHFAKRTPIECLQTELGDRNTEVSSKCAFDPMHPEYLSSFTAAGNRVDLIAERELTCAPSVDGEYAESLAKPGKSRSWATVPSLDIAELLWSNSHECSDNYEVIGNCDQMTMISMPDSGFLPLNDACVSAKSIGTSPTLHRQNYAITEEHDISSVLHNNKHIGTKLISDGAEERMCENSSAAIAKTLVELKSDDDRLHTETVHALNLYHKTSDTCPPAAASSVEVNELTKPDTTPAKCVITDSSSSGQILKEPFCLAGPKRALCSPISSSVVSSCSAVIKTGNKPLSMVSLAVNSTGNHQLPGTHVPLIRRTLATQNTAVSSAGKPGTVAVKISPDALSRVTCLPLPVRLSSHSPQPPSEPASRSAVAASQARFL